MAETYSIRTPYLGIRQVKIIETQIFQVSFQSQPLDSNPKLHNMYRV
jgi:hypothetical protein